MIYGYKLHDLPGKKCVALVDIVGQNCNGISRGTICTIVQATRAGLTVCTEKCTHCGQKTYIKNAHRKNFRIIDEKI